MRITRQDLDDRDILLMAFLNSTEYIRYMQITKLLVKAAAPTQAEATPVQFFGQDGGRDFNMKIVTDILNNDGSGNNPQAVMTWTKRATTVLHDIQVIARTIDTQNFPTVAGSALDFAFTMNPNQSINDNGKDLTQGEPSTRNIIMWNKDDSNNTDQI